MAEHANVFLVVTILVLLTILIVSGMKYFSSAKQALGRTAADDALRKLAETSAASAASLTALQAAMADVKTRLAAIEKMLREVE